MRMVLIPIVDATLATLALTCVSFSKVVDDLQMLGLSPMQKMTRAT